LIRAELSFAHQNAERSGDGSESDNADTVCSLRYRRGPIRMVKRTQHKRGG